MWLIDFLSRTIRCSCGRTHEVPAIEIVYSQNLSERLTDFFDNAIFIADQNTALLAIVPAERTFVLKDPHRVIATMENVQKVLDFLKDKNCQDIVSIGSGSLTDITRYSAYLSKIDFSCFPTAPSVDAYTSSVAPLIIKGVKKTLNAGIPKKVLIDPDVLVNSPADLLKAGIGDISSKITARLDWILSNFLTGEYICDFVWDNMKDLLKAVMVDVKKILHRDRSSVLNLMKVQLISGLNITIVGNSRPASGAEHLISHVMEMYQECRGQLPLFHGLQVAMGTYITLKAYKAFLEDLHFSENQIPMKDRENLLISFFGQQIAKDFQKTYLGKKRAQKIDIKGVKKLLESLYLQYYDLVETSLIDMGIKELFTEYDGDFIKNAVVISTMIRDRYTILDLFDQLGILGDFCDWFVEQLQ